MADDVIPSPNPEPLCQRCAIRTAVVRGRLCQPCFETELMLLLDDDYSLPLSWADAAAHTDHSLLPAAALPRGDRGHLELLRRTGRDYRGLRASSRGT